MSEQAVPRPPKGLGAAGQELWRALHAALPAEAEFDERELVILTLAARQADDVAALEGSLRSSGPVVEGSQGQPRLSGAVAEARQGRLAVSRLLGALELPDFEAERLRSSSSKRAQHAANARWSMHELKKARGSRGA